MTTSTTLIRLVRLSFVGPHLRGVGPVWSCNSVMVRPAKKTRGRGHDTGGCWQGLNTLSVQALTRKWSRCRTTFPQHTSDDTNTTSLGPSVNKRCAFALLRETLLQIGYCDYECASSLWDLGYYESLEEKKNLFSGDETVLKKQWFSVDWNVFWDFPKNAPVSHQQSLQSSHEDESFEKTRKLMYCTTNVCRYFRVRAEPKITKSRQWRTYISCLMLWNWVLEIHDRGQYDIDWKNGTN